MEEAGFDDRVTEAGKAELLGAARKILPGLAAEQITAAWAGLRPKVLRRGGAILQCGEISILAGHYRSGILAAPHDAGRLVDQLLGPEPGPPRS